MFPIHLWKNKKDDRTAARTEYLDTVVNSIQPLPLPITNSIYNTQNNKIPQVDIFANNVSTSSFADQDVVSDEINYSYDHTTSYPTDSVVFQGSK